LIAPLQKASVNPHPRRHRWLRACLLATAIGAALSGTVAAQESAKVTGMVWQVDNATLEPHGNWDHLGATELLIQWSAVDGMAFVPDAGMPSAPRLPDWQRIAGEPWAQTVILGLAGRFDETAARADIKGLALASQRLAQLPTPLHVVGWYFPVEIDPTWSEAPQLAPLLANLPRPLWISVYDSANVGPDALVDRLMTWLPPDVGIFFQDGVGVHAREAKVARHYADVMSARLGRDRVRLIAEAFRPQQGGGFRSATAAEIRSQLQRYGGYRVYLFDGPHYVPDALVTELAGPRAKSSR
jgi:hypothetical protein